VARFMSPPLESLGLIGSVVSAVVVDKDYSTTNHRWCHLCFRCVVSEKKSSILSTSVVHRLLEDRVVPTPFLYAYLQELRKKTECFNICTSCDSWVRRQSAPSKRCGKKVVFQVDRLILSVVLPGEWAPPEMRITHRLVKTLRENGGINWFATICPPLVTRALCDNDIVLKSRQVLKSIPIAAWRSGRRQQLLGSAKFAKYIRSAPEGY
jgi:hypothetical protein